MEIPLNPVYNSLNLGQAVLLVAYTLWQTTCKQSPSEKTQIIATQKDKTLALEALHHLLTASGFFYPENLEPTMQRNIRNIFTRANLTEQRQNITRDCPPL